jgi:hypothetical protein
LRSTVGQFFLSPIVARFSWCSRTKVPMNAVASWRCNSPDATSGWQVWEGATTVEVRQAHVGCHLDPAVQQHCVDGPILEPAPDDGAHG